MKSAIGGAIALALAAWLLFVFASPDPCTRVDRSGVPVRGAMDLARWAGKHWLSEEGKLDMLYWSAKADEGWQGFISHQFYGAQVCVADEAAKEAQPEQGQANEAQPGKEGGQ